MFLVHAINDAIKRKTEAPSCAQAGSQIPAFRAQQGGLGMRFLGFQGGKTSGGSWGRGRDKGQGSRAGCYLLLWGVSSRLYLVPSGQHSF